MELRLQECFREERLVLTGEVIYVDILRVIIVIFLEKLEGVFKRLFFIIQLQM